MKDREMIQRTSKKYLAFLLAFALAAVTSARAQDESSSLDDLFPEDSAGDGVAADTGTQAPSAEPGQQLSIDEALQQTQAMMAQGRYLEAIANYSRILSAPSGKGNVAALVGRGRAFFEIKN